MDSLELKEIINLIMELESLDLTGVAAKASADRSYLSKLINSEEPLNVGPRLKTKMQRAFPGYFPENNKNHITSPQKYEREYIQLLRDDRTLLAGIIESNLKLVLETLRTVAVRQEVDEEVILESLARLEGKPEKELYRDAGKRKSQKEQSIDKHGKRPA